MTVDRDVLRSGPLGALPDEALDRLVAELDEVRCAVGELLLRAGELGDDVFVVLEGRLEALAPGEGPGRPVLGAIGPGGLVGEMALVAGGERSVDVRASEPVRLARLTRERFDHLMEASPETGRRVTGLVLERARRSELAPHLDRLFGPFADDERELLDELVSGSETVELPRTGTLFERGDPADAAYVVTSGALRVAVDGGEEGERVVAELGRGELVGEMALVADDRRTATVYAVRDSELARVPREAVERLVERRPRTAITLAGGIVRRLLPSPGAVRSAPVTCLGLLAASGGEPVGELAERLVARLGLHGRVELLTSERVDAALGRRGAASAAGSDAVARRLARWIHEVEEANRYVVYVADREWTPWSERCARQVDHLVTIADAGRAPGELGALEARLEARRIPEREARRTLLLLHPEGVKLPRETCRWLAARDVDEVLHLRRDVPADLPRVGRILAGREVGVVFGGGGARGFAHLGVLRALEELGVPVDRIGGASIGAPVTVPTAQGLDAAKALELVDRGFRSLLDYTLPLASLLAGRRITQAIESHMAGLDVEDLPVPYFCVSTNLTTARSVVHRSGPLARAVRASVSIPGVLPPVAIGSDLHVDGGVLDNLPIEALRTISPGATVLAMDVAPPGGPEARDDFGLAVSGWGLALERFRPGRRRRRIPGIAATILHSQIVAANRARARMLEEGLPDFYRNIHVRGVGLLDFEKVRPVAKIGYEDAIEPLREWVAGRPAEEVVAWRDVLP